MGRQSNPPAGTRKSIQRGVIALTSVTSATATVTAVNTSKARLYNLGWSISSGGSALDSVRVALTNSTTITATRGNTGGAVDSTVSWELEEFY